MKLVIAEYLRTLKERDELDRLLPDLLVEMGYVPVARPQTGNRQYGVDLAVRGQNPEDGKDELVLFVIKQGNIGRTEWEEGNQAVRKSINEIFDVYLRSHLEPQDKDRRLKIVLATNGELKQVIQANWSGFVSDNSTRATFEFWGLERLAELVERHLLDEHVFHDEDRKQLRRALALSGDGDYDQRDLHQLFLRTLGLNSDGTLPVIAKSNKELLKALRIVNLSAQAFASWSANDGDARQGLKAMERALLWSWHRIQLVNESDRDVSVANGFSSLWMGYLATSRRYFEKLQTHCYVEDGLSGYYSDGSEFSLVAFEQIGFFATIGLAQITFATKDAKLAEVNNENAKTVGDALANLIKNNGICSSPCLDRHSQDITLALILLLATGLVDQAKAWLMKLVRNIDYAYKAQRYIPVSSDSLDDLAEASGWSGEQADPRFMNMSWMLPTLASWCALLKMDDYYRLLAVEAKESYPEVCMQLWHPDADIYRHLYFQKAQYICGASEAPITLPTEASIWREHMAAIVASEQLQIVAKSTALHSGLSALDLIANRHFSTPLAPAFWYQLTAIISKNIDTQSDQDAIAE